MIGFAELLQPVTRLTDCQVVYPWRPERYARQERLAVLRGDDVLFHLGVLDSKKRRFLLTTDGVPPAYLGLFREVLGRDKLEGTTLSLKDLDDVLRLDARRTGRG